MDNEFKISSSPPTITKKAKIEIECPNDSCSYIFNVANIDWGLAMECPKCKNKTYNPTYDKNKYTLKQIFVSSIISLIIGILAGLFVKLISN